MMDYVSLTTALGDLNEPQVLALVTDFLAGNPTEAE